jgi:small Trp-rich protein
MYFLLIGIAAMVMKYLEFGPVATLSWWVVLSPFAMAVAWWAWADSSGYTKRKEMDKMDKRKQDRLEKQREQMGMLSSKRKK